MAAKRGAAKKRPGNKKSNKPLFIGIGVLVMSLLIWVGMQRPQGTIKFGICKTFVEQTLTYPLELRISSAAERPTDVKMEYTTINEYGEYILSTIVCAFRPDPVTTWAISEVQLNRQKLPQADVEKFNQTIPFILTNPPDLTLPTPFPDDLQSLQR